MTKPKFNTESSLVARSTISAQSEKYIKVYQNEGAWRAYAAGKGVRLPPYYTRPTLAGFKRWLKICGVSAEEVGRYCGWSRVEEFSSLNPTHGMKGLAGVIIQVAFSVSAAEKIMNYELGVLGMNAGIRKYS